MDQNRGELVPGVILVHGPPAMLLIYAGAAVPVVATAWNVWARRGCSQTLQVRVEA